MNLEIDCPNLVSLTIIWFEVGKCCVKNLSSLAHFRTFIGHRRDRYYGYWNKIMRMLDQVPHVRSLAVQNWWLKVFNMFCSEFFILNVIVLLIYVVNIWRRLVMCQRIIYPPTFDHKIGRSNSKQISTSTTCMELHGKFKIVMGCCQGCTGCSFFGGFSLN